ncbi:MULTISPECIES: hypothetical protein [unclassified Streptomyces]|uniref:hypothetical protein n=1 Tax=unclassified Streptomyces TaxID=2593676 RepID=UPI002E1B261F|nr:hypothetical protein OG217_04070 [Streptomyces sp. NBC_01023]
MVDDVHRLETKFAVTYPTLRVLDRTVTLHVPKRMGQIFDADGHASATVALGSWAGVA